jgi:D-alanyl-D-alanine carboxypeptidase (penicillin-binding protein 5/6)
MTIYTVLWLSDTLKISLKSPVLIDDSVTTIIGTTAFLCPGDTLTVNDLLYGLMLPSGNDAAHMLAKFFGDKLLSVEGDDLPVDFSLQSSELNQFRSKRNPFLADKTQYW